MFGCMGLSLVVCVETMEETLEIDENPMLPSLLAGGDAAAERVVVEDVLGAVESGRGALESTALKATVWTILDYGAGQAVRLVNSYVLTRLLFPAAFGTVTLVTTLIVGITLLSDIGLGPSIIQSERGDDPKFLNTAWTLQFVRGAVLWLLALLLAWPVAKFYNDRTLMLVLPLLGFTVVLKGLEGTSLLTLSRHMGVRRLFFIDFSTQIVALVVTVTWAWKAPSVWALVAGSLISNSYKMILSHSNRVTPGLRNRFAWDPESLRSILHFGKWIFLGTAFFFFASQADRLILGKVVTLTTLGVYGIAYSLSDVPRSVIGAFSYKVGYPFIAKIVHLPLAEFRVQFLRYRGYALLVGGFLLSLMAIFGDQLVLKLYKPAYWDAAWMVPVLALGLWHTLLYQTTSPVLLSLGKSKYNAIGNGAYCACVVIGMPLAFHVWGLAGAVVAVALGDFPYYLVLAYGAVREGVKPLRQDFVMTLAFVALLVAEYGVRRVGLHLPGFPVQGLAGAENWVRSLV